MAAQSCVAWCAVSKLFRDSKQYRERADRVSRAAEDSCLSKLRDKMLKIALITRTWPIPWTISPVMSPKCKRCDDARWVCEHHSDLPWGSLTRDAHAGRGNQSPQRRCVNRGRWIPTAPATINPRAAPGGDPKRPGDTPIHTQLAPLQCSARRPFLLGKPDRLNSRFDSRRGDQA